MKTKKLAPVHPGEVLLGEFLLPMGISQYRLSKTSACRRGGSTRSFTARAQSPPTQRSGSPSTSVRASGSGSTFRRNTIWMSSGTVSATDSTKKSRRARPFDALVGPQIWFQTSSVPLSGVSSYSVGSIPSQGWLCGGRASLASSNDYVGLPAATTPTPSESTVSQ